MSFVSMLRPDDRKKNARSEHGHSGLVEQNQDLFCLLTGSENYLLSHNVTFSIGLQDMVAIATWAC